MSWLAFADESARFGKIGYYLFAAVIVEDIAAEELRQIMAPLAHRPKGFHWNEANEKRRWVAIETICSSEALHVVVVGSPMDPSRQERARRTCLERLLFELESAGVAEVALESRGETLDRRDQQVVDSYLARRVIRHLRVKHAEPMNEPLLWIPDITAGAVGLAAEGSDSSFRQMLSEVVEIHEVRLT